MGVPKEELDDSVNLKMDGIDSSLGFLLRLAQLQAFDEYYSSDGNKGLKPSELMALLILKNNPGTKQSVLAATLRIKRANMTKLVRSLEDKQFIIRAIPEDNRRTVELTLSEAGEQILDLVVGWFQEHEASLGRKLGKADHTALVRILKGFVALGQ